MKQWWRSLGIATKLNIPIQLMLLLLLSLAQLWIIELTKSEIMEGAQRRAYISADGIINGMNMLMITDKITDAKNRRLFIDKMGTSEHIKELRIIRSKQVQNQFGPGLPEEQVQDEMDRLAIASKKTQFKLQEDQRTPTLRVVMPFIASTDFRGTNCLACHHVENGSVNGAASITIDMSEEFAAIKRTRNLLIAGQVGLQILLFITIGWLLRRFFHPLQKLQRTMKSMQTSGSMEQYEPVSTNQDPKDEIGELTLSFDRMAAALYDSEQSTKLAQAIYLSNADAIVVTNENNLIVDVNPAFTRITGHSREEVLGKDPKLMSSGRHDRAFYAEMWNALLTHDRWQGEIWDRHKDGSAYIKAINIVVLRHKDGSVYRYVAQFSNITDKKEKDQLVHWQANYDPLTNLPNRRLFHDRLGQAIKMAHRTRFPIALLFIDLDHFKEINDNLGHAIGDALLMEVARRISACVREADTVSRLGGDEFTVILPEIGGLEQAQRIAQHIVETIADAFHFTENDQGHFISSSIGIAIYPDDAGTLEAMLRNADKAMYAAKQAGRNGYVCYSSLK
ncbi:MAG: diguanylate cyclase [Gallionella sp.]